jgi:hypothetical protein
MSFGGAESRTGSLADRGARGRQERAVDIDSDKPDAHTTSLPTGDQNPVKPRPMLIGSHPAVNTKPSQDNGNWRNIIK